MTHDPSDAPMREVLDRWKAAFDSHRADAMAALFAPDAFFQGFGPETLSGREAVRDYYEAVPARRAARVGRVQGYRIDEGVAGGFADVTFHDPDGWEAAVHLSLVLLRQDGDWRIRQYHVSRVSADR